jgi:hypothetical protein
MQFLQLAPPPRVGSETTLHPASILALGMPRTARSRAPIPCQVVHKDREEAPR